MTAQLPKTLAEPTEYDFFFSVKTYIYNKDRDYKIDTKVKQGKLVITAYSTNDTEYEQILYFYDADTQSVKEVNIDVTEHTSENGKITYTPKITNLDQNIKDLTLETNKTSPDGYTFKRKNHKKSGLYSDLFSYRANSHSYIIAKGRAYQKLDIEHQPYYWGRHDAFLGWVVER